MNETPEIRGLFWDGEALRFLEQTFLPLEEKTIRTQDWRVIVDAVKRLAIRGAPAIGVAGAFAAVLALRESNGDHEKWLRCLEDIEYARPTAVNLSRAVQRLREAAALAGNDRPEVVVTAEAERIAREDEMMCEAIAENGLELIPEGAVALTHCNTGALVTYGIGTALGVLRRAFERGMLEHVYACEARPLGQGARLTMWELAKLNIPATLLCDSAVGRLMQEDRIDLVIVGADRIAANGDTANKIGTLNLAVLSEHFSVPFYVAAPSTTFDCSLPDGRGIPIEYRDPAEIIRCGDRPFAFAGSTCFNPAFDVTPGSHISAFIREDGVFFPPFDFAGDPC